MSEINAIIKFLDKVIETRGVKFLTAPEAAKLLDAKGLLKDRKERPGMYLRRLLRSKIIKHAYQDGRYWRIPHS